MNEGGTQSDESCGKGRDGGIGVEPLLADQELWTEPMHVTVVGPKDDPHTRALLRSALTQAAAYKRVELWDRRDGPLPNADVEYPPVPSPAAFLCADGRCSTPAFGVDQLQERFARLRTQSNRAPRP